MASFHEYGMVSNMNGIYNNKSHYFLLLFNFVSCAAQKLDPFSKINISSNKATCQRDEKNSSLFKFSYQKNVKVYLADETKIKSQKLDIWFNEDLLANDGQKNQNRFQKITFHNNVCIKKGGRTVRADKVEIFPDKQQCKFIGNVVIKQLKKKSSLVARGSKAILDLKTEQITLLGNQSEPVNSVLRLSKPETQKTN